MIGFLFLAYIQGFSQTYNPELAAAYAQKWCNDRNLLEYPDYPGVDCANFVSQCLKAGGLDLSKGSDGNGNGVVQPYGVIPGATNLLLHLTSFQKADKRVVQGNYPPVEINHDLGDPMFHGSSNGLKAYHSHLCSSVFGNSRSYSMHSEDHCDKNVSGWYNYYIFFHIKSSYPNHCFDCEKNGNEDEIDCGGPCPSCERAPNERHYNTPTTNLPTVARAIQLITAGNAEVKILSGQNVEFITAGTIDLLPGFEVEAGGNFNASPKGNILSVTGDCNDFCWPFIYTGYNFVRWYHHYLFSDVANTYGIYFEIYWWNHWDKGMFVINNYVSVTQDGSVKLWDLVSGNLKGQLEPGSWHVYLIEGHILPCQDPFSSKRFRTFFNVHNFPDDLAHLQIESIEDESAFHFPSLTIGSPPKISPILVVFPNPNPGTFQIETNFPLSEIAHLKITNLLGIPVYETQNVTSYTIQLPASASGQHFVVMHLKDGTLLTQKVMVQR